MSTVYLNGAFLPIEQARVSVMDRGFLFGDGVYEVIPAYGGRLFRFPHHLQRLQNSLDGIRLGLRFGHPAAGGTLQQFVNDRRECLLADARSRDLHACVPVEVS